MSRQSSRLYLFASRIDRIFYRIFCISSKCYVSIIRTLSVKEMLTLIFYDIIFRQNNILRCKINVRI